MHTVMDDDEMIVIIIGDEGEDHAIPNTSTIKEEQGEQFDELEHSDLNPEFILETAEMHGEYIDIKKEECDIEYLEDDILEEISEHGEENPKSYIYQLRKNFPKMRKDDNYLIAHLTEAMRNTKAPSPPKDFCIVVNGILVCKYCNAENITLPSACRHYQKKHGSRVFVCFACGATFKCTTGLYKHEKRCQAPGSNLMLKARGQYLGRKARSRPYITRNKFSPGSMKPKHKDGTQRRYDCSQCSATFKYKDALQSHVYMHSGIRPFQCEQCPMAYTSKIALRRHFLATHSDVQYICDTCKRSFKSKNTLITHMDTHLPLPKYPCDRCERRFAQKYAVRNHINRDHLNIPPPFACAACPKRFPRLSNLKAHMKAKHGLTLMSRRSFMKALPSMPPAEQEELKQATVVYKIPPGRTFNDDELINIHEDATSDPSITSGEGIVGWSVNRQDVDPLLEETPDAPNSEDQIQELEDTNIQLPEEKRKKKKVRTRQPKIDLSFVTKRREKILVGQFDNVKVKNRETSVIEEDADVCNFMPLKGDACDMDNSGVNEFIDSTRRELLEKYTQLKKGRCTVIMNTDNGENIYTPIRTS